MEQNNELKLFEDKKIRAKWNDEQEKWYFSVVDVIAVLTDNDYQKSRNYWKWLKNKLNEEGSELVSNTNQLKMRAYDGKLRDNMTNMELVLNMLAETSSTEISKSKNRKGFKEAEDSVKKGGNIAKLAKEQLEKETGKKVISDKNAKEIRKLNSGEE